MDFALTAEQEELKKLAQKAFAGKDVVVEAERAGLFDAADLGFVELCVVLEQLGRAGRPQPLEAAFLGALMAKRPAVWCDGDLRIERSRVNGVLDGVAFTDRPLVVAAAGQLFLVDPKAAQRVPQQPTDESALWQLTFKEAEVAEPIGPDTWAQHRTVGLCAVELGIAQAQLQMTAEHVMRRQQFGKPIGLFQAVAQRCGDMWVDVESMRLTTWRAAWLLGQGRDAAREAHSAAFFAADAGQRVANGAQHLHAGIGFDRAYPLHRYFLAAKQLELSLGGANRRLAQLGAMFGS
jgi:3-oxocholest-4-en-26-oyl-CoA dehydrogenase beta subunit